MVDLATGLAGFGNKVQVVTGKCHSVWKTQLGAQASKIVLSEAGQPTLGNPSFWLHLMGVAAKLSRLVHDDTQAVVASSFPAAIAAAFFKRRTGKRVLHYMHEAPPVLHDAEALATLPWTRRTFYQAMVKVYSRRDIAAVQTCDRLTANSQFTRQANARIYGTSPDSIKVVYPGVNPCRFRPSTRLSKRLVPLFSKVIKPVFFPLAAIPWRNPSIMLQALKRSATKDAVGLFTGGSLQDSRSMHGLAKKLNVHQRVFWINRLSPEELNAVYTHAKLVVLTPRRQPFGLMALETLCCGTPVIISRNSGAAEILKHLTEAVHVDPGSPDELARALDDLLADEHTAKEQAQRGKDKVLSEFTSERFAQRVLKELEAMQPF